MLCARSVPGEKQEHWVPREGGLHGDLSEVGRQISNLVGTGEVSAKALRRVHSQPGRGPRGARTQRTG